MDQQKNESLSSRLIELNNEFFDLMWPNGDPRTNMALGADLRETFAYIRTTSSGTVAKFAKSTFYLEIDIYTTELMIWLVKHPLGRAENHFEAMERFNKYRYNDLSALALAS